LKGWYEVDSKGLRKLFEAKGKGFAVLELLGNAWDADQVSRVDIELYPVDGVPKATLVVRDDSPVGFQHLEHAWTLFAESNRKGHADKRGRFNLGEKLVLAICDTAEIRTTTGTVTFSEDRTRKRSSARTSSGSEFRATLAMTRADLQEALDTLRCVLPPVPTYLNGSILSHGVKLRTFETNLPTEYADSEGVMRRTRRNTKVEVWSVPYGSVARIYEMGIPIVETGDKYHVNILQKVPLSMNRDNVTPAYLQEVRTAVLNEMYAEAVQSESDATQTWVRNAIEDGKVNPEAVRQVVTKQYGERAVIFDPTDVEGTNIAVSRGYNVIHGGSFSKEAWTNIRAAEVVLPAGKVTPSPKPFSPEGNPLKLIRPEDYTREMQAFEKLAQQVAGATIGRGVEVRFTRERTWNCVAAFGPDCALYLNVSKISLTSTEGVLELLLHEYAHFRVQNHLSSEFYDEIARLGSRLAIWAAQHPSVIEEYGK
jgi:hypothetical protein